MGRVSKLTQDRRDGIVRDLKTGCTMKNAAEANGVSEATFHRWMQRNEGFASAIREACAVAERSHVRTVVKASAGGDWRAALEWLKRRRPDDWGDRVTHDLDNEIMGLLRQLSGEVPSE